jgi:RNA polymerase sigma-70 factor (sigma-E family)
VLRPRQDEEFAEFVAARMNRLRKVAYLLCQNWHRADDLVQSALTRLYAHWDRAAVMDHPDAYLRTIVVREYLTERRSGWARRVSANGVLPEVVASNPDHDAALDLRAALPRLPPRQRATLVLRFYCDLSVDETARLLGCTPGTVKSQTAKAMNSLRSLLDPASGRS